MKLVLAEVVEAEQPSSSIWSSSGTEVQKGLVYLESRKASTESI